MDRLESMTMLLAVVEAGNLSAASRQLNTPLATVSRRISDLEAHLKTKLLNRSSRHVTLTDAGQAYIVACRRILEDLSEAERAASGEYTEPKGELVLTAPPIFGRVHLMPIVVDFLKTYPDINIRVVLVDHVLNLFEEHIDVALRIGDLADSSLIGVQVGMVNRVVCASPEYFARRGMPSKPADLADHDGVSYDGPIAALGWNFPSGKGRETVQVKSRLAANTALVALDGALGGLGVSRLPSDLVMPYVESGELVLALTAHEPEPLPVHLVHTGGRRVPRKLRVFLDYTIPKLRSRLARI